MAVANLYLYSQKVRLELTFEDVGCVGPDHIRTFTVRAVLGGKPYPEGVGKNKKEAKLKAAENALIVLSEETNDHAEQTGASAAPADQTSISQPKYMSWLNEYSQKEKCEIRPVESMRLGSTDATQCCRFVVGGKEYPVATGRTKKDAKEEAAKLVHHEICGSNTTESVEEKFSGTSSQQKEELNRNVSDVCDQMKSLSVIPKDSKDDMPNFSGKNPGSSPSKKITTPSRSTDNTSVKYLHIQMELCDNKTLRVWIDEKNIQNVKKSLRDSKRREESLNIARQIVSAVEYIHSNMLIHRDLKPANILFGQDGEVKIGDFGLVTEENNADAENLLERTVYKGTPSYMAPEQVWNDARNQKFPEGFPQNFPLEIEIIKSMLCQTAEERPEASRLTTELEKCSQTLTMLKDARRTSRTF
ncbi:Eukaryotic translation initiation factor 2-alpha kinase [Liparis tanakae]|uniref:Eukaryotic translation initiation factor 2-alpha kinase n=1 Tax=Liparis tanakae TaxID=230148 RepID=A0A4Z2H9U8_9TELE|nr:Eukaryotic translation initiation factor 2-alpha kinase [Liparis tanakae]